MALEVIESVRGERPDVALRIVDVSAAPEVAIRYAVTATPALTINGRLAFRGVPTAEALTEELRKARG